MGVLEQQIHFTPNSLVIPATFLDSASASPPPTQQREAQWAVPLDAGHKAQSEESRLELIPPPKL